MHQNVQFQQQNSNIFLCTRNYRFAPDDDLIALRIHCTQVCSRWSWWRSGSWLQRRSSWWLCWPQGEAPI